MAPSTAIEDVDTICHIALPSIGTSTSKLFRHDGLSSHSEPPSAELAHDGLTGITKLDITSLPLILWRFRRPSAAAISPRITSTPR